jgi:hypothetical protein
MVDPRRVSMSAEMIICARCDELQSKDHLRCARCGDSLETKEQRRVRLARLERSRRAAEREDVSIHRIPGFGINGTSGPRFGTKEFFQEMSNQRRRSFIVLGVIIVAFVAVLAR